jgi:macrolide phosphotransferase
VTAGPDPDAGAVAGLAAARGLAVEPASIRFNEAGLDFRIAFATAADGDRWVLRLPRRADVLARARGEAAALAFLRPRLPVEVPDWRIVADDLIAYPMLQGAPGLTFDAVTHAVTWHFDPASPHYPRTLGTALAARHAIDAPAARAAGLPHATPDEVRGRWQADLARVAETFAIPPAALAAWQAWIADPGFWPEATVPVHGDLYAGHAMVDPEGRVTGIIDWTEARIGDPAVDLAGHIKAFGEPALAALIDGYAAASGRTWPRLAEHCRLLHSASAVEYALFALRTGEPAHRQAAQAALDAATPPA